MHIKNLVDFYQFVLKQNYNAMTDWLADGLMDNPNPVKPHFFKVGLLIDFLAILPFY